MSLDMFWGGAPQPINTPEDALAQLRINEFSLHEQSDSDFWNEQSKPASPRSGDTGKTLDKEAKKRRVIGGLAAVPKRITADYDSDDARIIDLKQQSYCDEYVADKLVEEGRTRYAPKTIGCRWLRLRKILEKREDERLDDELSDWHVGEDEQLRAIKEEVDKKFQLAFQRLKDQQWHEISVFLAEKTNKRKYTSRACFERFQGLVDGTALPPIELDDDQEGRRKLREERIAAAKARRAAMAQEKKDIEAARLARIEEKKQYKIDEANRRQEEKSRKEDQRRERKRREESKNAVRIKAREARELYLEQIRLEREWEVERLRVEKAVYKELTGKELFGNPAPRGRKQQQGVTMDWASDEEDLDETVGSASDVEDYPDLDRADSVADFEPKSSKKTASKKRAEPAGKNRTRNIALHYQAVASATDAKGGVAVDASSTGGQDFVKAVVTRDTLLNPRSILNSGELKAVLCRRDLTPRWQEGETHAELVARIAQADESLKVDELRSLCKAAGASYTGKKSVLVRALAESDARLSFAGNELDMASSDVEFMMGYDGYQGEFKVFLDEAIQEARDRGEDLDDFE